MLFGLTPYGSGGGTSSANLFEQKKRAWWPAAAALVAAWNSMDVFPLLPDHMFSNNSA